MAGPANVFSVAGPPAALPGDVVLLDFDGDGRLDVFSSDGVLVRNAGGLSFTDESALIPDVYAGYPLPQGGATSGDDGYGMLIRFQWQLAL